MQQRAFTLVELMISVAIGMLMIAVTWTAFTRVKTMTTRATARIDLHAAAASVRDAVAADLRNLAPSLAMFARSVPATVDATTKTETVELVFMRPAAPLRTLGMRSDREQYLADNHWVRWRFTRTLKLRDGAWSVSTAALRRASSTPTRSWTTTSALAASTTDPADGTLHADYGGTLWINIPRPLRDASQGITSLDNNRYGVPSAAIDPASPQGDIGDLADLDANEMVVSTDIRDFALGWARADGAAIGIHGRTAADLRVDGQYPDALGPAGNNHAAQAAARPQVLRVAMLMAKGDVVQEMSFSVATPGLRAQIAEASP